MFFHTNCTLNEIVLGCRKKFPKFPKHFLEVSREMKFLDLPKDILARILGGLQAHELYPPMASCKLLYAVAQEDSLWKALTARTWTHIDLSKSSPSDFKVSTWKQLFDQ